MALKRACGVCCCAAGAAGRAAAGAAVGQQVAAAVGCGRSRCAEQGGQLPAGEQSGGERERRDYAWASAILMGCSVGSAAQG